MLKQILFTSTALLIMNGCVVKERVIVQEPNQNHYQPAQASVSYPIHNVVMEVAPTETYSNPIIVEPTIPESAIELKRETFAGETLMATPEVSALVAEIEALSTQSAYLKMNSKQNVEVGAFLNIEATPNRAGYLKIMIIDPNGERSLVLPNSLGGGRLKANERFYSNNGKFAFKATNPTGLHYVIIIFSEQNARMVMRQGANGYNAITNNQDLIDILSKINAQEYGRSYISIFPMRVY